MTNDRRTARLARCRAARLRDARPASPEIPAGAYAERLDAPARASRRPRLRPARRLRRSRAQREPRLADRFRPALRGGAPRRRARWGRGSGDPGRQRVLRDGRRRAAADAAASCSRISACRASHATGRGRWPRSSPTRASDAGSRVGVVGWKTYADRSTIEVPAFIVDELRRLTGRDGLVENATDLLIDAADGLRVVNDVDGLAALEWAVLSDLERRPAPALGASTGDDRARGGPPARAGTGCRCRAI